MSVLDDPAVLFDEAAIQNPYPLYDRLRADGPVHRVGQSGFHLVCSWAAVSEAVKRPDDFSSNLTATMTYRNGAVSAFEMDGLGGPTQILATADDPAHAVHRRMLVPQLAAKRLLELERFVSDAFGELWARGVRDGRIEWMDAVANRLPMMVVARLIGVPVDDADALARWGCASTALLDGLVDEEQLAAAGTAATELGAYIGQHFATAAADSPDTLLGSLAKACAAGELDPMTAHMMMIIVFSAGGESTGSLLGNAMEVLSGRPDLVRRLRDDRGLVGPFIEEVLRFEPPFRGHYRHVVADTALCGVDLPAGSRLLLLWGAANRDPAHFDDPHDFRVDRSGAKGHIAFGKGAHFCVGAALARLEARIVLHAILDRVDTLGCVELGPWLPSMLVRRRRYLRLAVS